LRSLTHERGPWSSEVSSSSSPTQSGIDSVHWKLDKTENFSRMRLKLKRNYDFSDHTEASIDYISPEEKQQEERKISNDNDGESVPLSGIKLAAIPGLLFFFYLLDIQSFL